MATKITIFLEEAKLAYQKIHPGQHKPGRSVQTGERSRSRPTTVSRRLLIMAQRSGGKPIPVFDQAQSSFILPKNQKAVRADLSQSQRRPVVWQMGRLGPMAGQNHHFSQYAPTKIQYAIDGM